MVYVYTTVFVEDATEQLRVSLRVVHNSASARLKHDITDHELEPNTRMRIVSTDPS